MSPEWISDDSFHEPWIMTNLILYIEIQRLKLAGTQRILLSSIFVF
jgi:hypothetical protein